MHALIAPTASPQSVARAAWDILTVVHRGCMYTSTHLPTCYTTELADDLIDSAIEQERGSSCPSERAPAPRDCASPAQSALMDEAATASAHAARAPRACQTTEPAAAAHSGASDHGGQLHAPAAHEVHAPVHINTGSSGGTSARAAPQPPPTQRTPSHTAPAHVPAAATPSAAATARAPSPANSVFGNSAIGFAHTAFDAARRFLVSIRQTVRENRRNAASLFGAMRRSPTPAARSDAPSTSQAGIPARHPPSSGEGGGRHGEGEVGDRGGALSGSDRDGECGLTRPACPRACVSRRSMPCVVM